MTCPTLARVPESDLGSWRPLSLQSLVDTFAPAPFRWWVSGGHALELHLARSWRAHGDTDVGIARNDLDAVYPLLAPWDPHIASAGHLAPWRGDQLSVDQHQNNVWFRRSAAGPWILDVTISEASDSHWIYRRDPAVQVPWDLAVLHHSDGIPYLAPELQLLYKSKHPRPKDDIDAAEVIPHLDERQRAFLKRSLGSAHPWQRLLA